MAAYDVTTAGVSLNFDTQNNNYNSCFKIDDTHIINFWMGENGNDGYAQVFTINTSTWAVTTAAARLEFDTVNGENNGCTKIDDNHFINFWTGELADGFAQVFTVNTSTWAVTTAAARLEFDTVNYQGGSCHLIDSNHVINFWQGNASDGFAQVFTVNTSTWAVTTAATSLEFDTVGPSLSDALGIKSCQIDDNHFITFWRGASDLGLTQTFTVNTSTWAVTTAAARLEFDSAGGGNWNSCFKIDDTHIINFWAEASGNDGFVQVFTVNTSTWAVTTAAARLEFDIVNGAFNSCYQVDSTHFINFWRGGSGDGFVQTFTINTSTWAVTTAAAALEFDTQNNQANSCFQIDTNHFINFWSGGTGALGYTQIFNVELPAVAQNTGNFFALI